MEELIQLREIKKIYRRKHHETFALDGINLNIHRGEQLS